MATVSPPDTIKLFLDQLRLAPDLVALGASVGTVRPATMPAYAVVLDVAGGAVDDALGLFSPRVQVYSYGPGMDIPTRQRTAMDLSRAVHAWLLAPDRSRPGGVWRSAAGAVKNIQTESWPIRLVEPEGWVCVLGIYRPLVYGVAA